MAGPERRRPAQELTTPPTTVPEHYLQYLREREGRLCASDELFELHLTIPQARTDRLRGFRELISDIRSKHLDQREKIITLIASRGRAAYGYYYYDGQGREAEALSEIGVSLFQDDPHGPVIPELSIPTKRFELNPLIENNAFVTLFDRLSAADNQQCQSPYLISNDRKLMTFLAEHPEGVDPKKLLREAMGVDLPNLERDWALIQTRLENLRRRVRGSFRICFLPSPRKPGERRKLGEGRYFLISEDKMGKEIQVPPEKREIFSYLPEPIREEVSELCNCFTVGKELKPFLKTPERRLLYFLASRFGHPCSMKELADAVYPVESPQDPLDALRSAKTRLQRTLEGSKFAIATVFRFYEVPGSSSGAGGYLLGDRSRFQKARVEIPFFLGELDAVDKEIRCRIRRICRLTTLIERDGREELMHFRPVISLRERKILLALARSFPEGCRFSF